MKVENNLDTDKVRGLVWRLAFPSMLAQFVNVMYSIVDRMYIGNIPEIGAWPWPAWEYAVPWSPLYHRLPAG